MIELAPELVKGYANTFISRWDAYPRQRAGERAYGLAPIQWRKISEKRYTELRRQVHEQARESA